MDAYEPIRRGYHAFGLGGDGDLRAMFDQDEPDPARWEIRRWGLWSRHRPAGDVAALAIFGYVPPDHEIAGVRIDSWEPDERTGRLVVDGVVRVRRHGSWDSVELPFGHVWSFEDGRVVSVLNVLHGYELRRVTRGARAA